MHARTLWSLFLVLLGGACGSAATEPPDNGLPDAMPGETDAMPGETDAMPGPLPARVQITVAGEPLSGTPVIFHDADGVPTHVLLTGSDGAAQAIVDPGAMATVLDLRGNARLTTFMGVEPGDDLLVLGEGTPGPEVRLSVYVDTQPDALVYRASVGCAETMVDHSLDDVPPPVTVLTLAIRAGCVVDGKLRLHVTAHAPTATLVLTHDLLVNPPEMVVDLKGQAFAQSGTARQVEVRSLGPEARVVGAAGFVLPSGSLAGFDLFEANADGEGALAGTLRGFPGREESVIVASPTPPPVIGASSDLTLRTMEIEHRGPEALTLMADFAEVKGALQLLSSEDKQGTRLLYLGLGDQTAMTGTVTTLLARLADDDVVSWTIVHPAGATFPLPTLPAAYAALRPVTFTLSDARLERGTAFPDYRAFRHVQGRLPARFTTYRSVLRVLSPTPAPLP